MKVIQLSEADRDRLAGCSYRQPQGGRQPGHDRIQVIDIHRQHWPVGQTWRNRGRLPVSATAEIGHHQQAHRRIGIPTGRVRNRLGQVDLEFHSGWHGI